MKKDGRRIAISVAPELQSKLQTLRDARFPQSTKAEMLRTLIALGLQQGEKELRGTDSVDTLKG